MNFEATLEQVLTEEYLSIGAIGSQAIASMWDDFANDRFDFAELGAEENEIVATLQKLTSWVIDNGYLHFMNTPGGWVMLADYETVIGLT